MIRAKIPSHDRHPGLMRKTEIPVDGCLIHQAAFFLICTFHHPFTDPDLSWTEDQG